jgi:hypothetical protein
MSYIFESGERAVWSPALRVGRTYVGYARVLEQVVGTPAGLEEQASDLFRLQPGAFAAFVQALLDAGRATQNRVLADQIAVVLLPSLVMLGRSGAPVDVDQDLAEQARDLARNMPQ